MSAAIRPPLPAALLYVPGDRPDRFGKAAAASPGIILDLEDSVAVEYKAAARAAVREYLLAPDRRCSTWVRVGRETLADDLAALTGTDAAAGIIVAKADVEAVRTVRQSLPDRPIVPMIETARALHELDAIGQFDEVATFALGEVDLLAELRIRRGPDTAGSIDAIRLELVLAAARVGRGAPVAPTSTDIRDAGLAESTAHLRNLGFRSRTAIHPAQVPVIVESFTPGLDEVRRAQAVIDALASAPSGAAVLDGRFVDAAVAREAHETLVRARKERSG